MQSNARWRAKAGRPLGRKAGWHLVFDCIGGVECDFDADARLGLGCVRFPFSSMKLSVQLIAGDRLRKYAA